MDRQASLPDRLAPGPVETKTMGYVVRVLNDLGLRAYLKLLHDLAK